MLLVLNSHLRGIYYTNKQNNNFAMCSITKMYMIKNTYCRQGRIVIFSTCSKTILAYIHVSLHILTYILLFARDSVSMNLTWLYIYLGQDSSSALSNYFIFSKKIRMISLKSYATVN